MNKWSNHSRCIYMENLNKKCGKGDEHKKIVEKRVYTWTGVNSKQQNWTWSGGKNFTTWHQITKPSTPFWVWRNRDICSFPQASLNSFRLLPVPSRFGEPLSDWVNPHWTYWPGSAQEYLADQFEISLGNGWSSFIRWVISKPLSFWYTK